ncbi:hypothetical protein NE619_16330, partial [Anaerovorax odorimutans]|nr:hypothetical protein [Anaerovorax odorimutans]
ICDQGANSGSMVAGFCSKQPIWSQMAAVQRGICDQGVNSGSMVAGFYSKRPIWSQEKGETMDNFEKTLNLEIAVQERLLKESKAVIKQAPEGYLTARQRPEKTDYYQTCKGITEKGWGNKSVNIKHDPDKLCGLIEKMLAVKTRKICNKNLPLMHNLLRQYQTCDRETLIQELPPKYRKALELRREKQLQEWLAADYMKCPFDSKSHIHETACGELVRSKSEVIIANALFGYGIPFRYEERFPYPSEDGVFYYPDFTIRLLDGRRLIWEHLGLLQELGYCIENAQKLHTYQRNNLVIGKNLILTQDDNKGNCSSQFIFHIIESYILPYFTGVRQDGKSHGAFHGWEKQHRW